MVCPASGLDDEEMRFLKGTPRQGSLDVLADGVGVVVHAVQVRIDSFVQSLGMLALGDGGFLQVLRSIKPFGSENLGPGVQSLFRDILFLLRA